MYYLPTNRKFIPSRLLLWLAVLTPAMPKIIVSSGTYIYLLEVFLLIFFPFFLGSIKHRIQVALLGFWLFILGATISSLWGVVDVGGLARVIKGIIYIPLFFISYKHFNLLWVKRLLVVFVSANILNVFLLYYNISLFGFNLWDVKTISSGLSNRYFSISDFNIGTIERGAHGIWGNYCVLVLALTLFLRIRRIISGRSFLFVVLFSFVGIGSSVSRESLIAFFFVIIGLFFWSVKEGRIYGVSLFVFRWFVVGGLALSLILYCWGEYVPIVNKLMYTVESVNYSGTEMNIQLRINGWKVFFESLQRNPDKIITGFGFNREYYESFLGFANIKYSGRYVSIPESFFIMALSYGGLFALLCAIWFFVEIFKIINRLHDALLRLLFLFFFFGIMIGNMLSGASIVSDLFYGQVLLVLGFLYKIKDEDFVSYSS